MSDSFSSADNPAHARERFVYMNADGSIREITDEEAAYLATAFHPADGGRPYIKASFRSRTPDKSLEGFLQRSELPKPKR